MKKKSRQQIVYEVALSGISTALALLLVWLSVVVRYGTIGFYVAACVALLVPLTNKYYFATICAYIASSLLAFAIVGDIFTIAGFVVYFAPISIASAIMFDKKVKWYIAIPVKAVYINLALAFLYYVAGTIMISADVMDKVPYYLVAIVGTIILLAIDFVVDYVYKTMKPIVSRALRKVTKNDDVVESVDEVNDDINVFDFEENEIENAENSDDNAENSDDNAENDDNSVDGENADENNEENSDDDIK